ncbi:hypothetical protein VTN02DRAFT_2337 [Thermoascus thermophilus]
MRETTGQERSLSLSLSYRRHVRSSESSPFHPPCPFRDRLKKALRLSCDLGNHRFDIRHVPRQLDTRLLTDIPWVGRSVTASADAVVAAVDSGVKMKMK